MSNPCLHMFVATHLESMNMGKAMVQAAHCANQFVNDWYIRDGNYTPELYELVRDWMGTHGFGTQVCLATDDFFKTYNDLNEWVESRDDVAFGRTIDPTYPFEVPKEIFPLLIPSLQTNAVERNGKMQCVRPQMTAFYIFGDRENPAYQSVMRKYKRHA